MDAYDAIARRVSTRAFQDRSVPRETIERLLGAAVRAPNHKLTEPWRFAVVTGASRDRLAELRRVHRAARFPDPAAPDAAKSIERTWRETRETPAFVVVLCAQSDDAVRREEDVASAWMAVQNLLTAATAEGLGTYVRTGGILTDPGVEALIRLPAGFRVIALVSLGYPSVDEAPRRRTPAAQKTLWLD
ncbi:MAG: nitroreductase [Gemmatimonadales bacterium]|jgi:nitroreductase